MRKYIHVATGLILSFVITLLLFVIAAMIINKAGFLPTEYLSLISSIAACIAVIAGAYAASSLIKERGWIIGLLVACIYTMIIVICGLITNGIGFTGGTFGRIICIFISGIIGGVSGVNRKQKVRF